LQKRKGHRNITGYDQARALGPKRDLKGKAQTQRLRCCCILWAEQGRQGC